MSALTRKVKKGKRKLKQNAIAYMAILVALKENGHVLDVWTPNDFMEFNRLGRMLPPCGSAFKLLCKLIQEGAGCGAPPTVSSWGRPLYSSPHAVDFDNVSAYFKMMVNDYRVTRAAKNEDGWSNIHAFSTEKGLEYLAEDWKPARLMELVRFCRMQNKEEYLNSMFGLLRCVQHGSFTQHRICYQEVRDAMNTIKVQSVMES